MNEQSSTTVQPLEKRRHDRTPLRSSARLSAGNVIGASKSFAADIKDASPAGMRLATRSNTLLELGDTVTVEWLIPAELSGGATGQRRKIAGQVVRVAKGDSSAAMMDVGIRFNGLVSEQLYEAAGKWHRYRMLMVMAALAILIVALKSRNIISFWYQPLFQAYSLAAAVFVLSRAVLSLFYRQPKDNGYLPSISIIIAAKNEEARLPEVIEHSFNANYPTDLIEVIVVDDGSTDNTWEAIQACQLKYPQLHIFKFDQNRGKRHAMALGAKNAKGKILIFMDSDSNVEPEGFYRIVQPFADKRVGAVAGHTDVIIEENNFISKMEAVRYFVSQRVMKASESLFYSVTCCPGPFSAYRRDAMLKVLPAWENQRFFGTQATFGDDRSLTNFILREYRVLYHAGARCATYTPDKWSVFFRQQLRWKKSWFRETWIAVRFMWKKHPAVVLAYYTGVVITLVSPFIGLRALLYLPLVMGTFSFAPYIGGLLLVYAFFGLIYAFFTRQKGWYYGMAFGVMYVVVLSLQNYYALLTVSRNHWGTR